MYDLLKGLTVVEAAAFIAGPSSGLYLAQFGAQVIRIDTIGGGPDFRRWPLAPSGDSLYWEGLNKGKKSICIDLGRPEGREIAQRLATAAGDNRGLFVTNFPVEGFLSYQRLKALREDVICVRVMGWADGRPALDYTVNASLGLPLMTGFADDPRPVNHQFPAWDFITGAYAALALVSAERARRMGGGGCEVRIPLSDIAATALANFGLLAEVLLAGADRPRQGNDVFGAFGRDFEIQGGRRLMVVAITARQWRALRRHPHPLPPPRKGEGVPLAHIHGFAPFTIPASCSSPISAPDIPSTSASTSSVSAPSLGAGAGAWRGLPVRVAAGPGTG